MQVKCERETRAMQVASGTPWETVTLTMLSCDRALFAPLLAEARNSALRGQEGCLVVHIAWGTEWCPFGLPRCKRPLHSVVLTPGIIVNR
ncbi:BCS1 N terminal-domain-containing protein [Russula emetica]|nr:BCS1 N terminal-domain-containing protein [Russula emetica]